MIPDLVALARIGIWLASVMFGGFGMWLLAMAWVASSPMLLLQAGICLAIAGAIVASGALGG